MTHKTKIACNRIPMLFILCGAFLGLMSYSMLSEGEIGLGIGCAAFALLCVATPLVFMPIYYRFDAESLTLCYLFFPNERYLWTKIRDIEVHYESKGFTKFRLTAKPEGKKRFYMEGTVYKTFRTKRLLERYWDGTITGYLFEDVQHWFRKRRKNKEKQIRLHLTDEVIPMERQAREEARSTLTLYEAMAAQMGLELRTKYCYTDEDFEETNSRPDSNYTYTALVELSYPGETAEDRVIMTSADLLHVRLGRTAYRGVRDEDALPDLRLELDELFDEVRKKGLDAYLQEFNEE